MRTRLFLTGVLASVLANAEPVRVSERFGFDAGDSTRFIQAALDSGLPEILIDRQETPWFVRPLSVRSGQTVLLDEGAVVMAKQGEFKGKNDVLVSCRAVTNVVLRGLRKGATFRMRIADYQGPDYMHGEWRHALRMSGVCNVHVENLTFADSGGDGIYVGSVDATRQISRNVVIRDCICDNNNRQGISVISADGLLIERTVMKNTRGTAPKSGIDFEPNLPWEKLRHVYMRDCVTENNAGAGYEFALNYLDDTSEAPTIVLENCRSVGDSAYAVKVNMRRISYNNIARLGQPKGGYLKVRNCLFKDNGMSGLTVEDKPLGVVDIEFENCTFENCPKRTADGPAFRFFNSTIPVNPTDGIVFRDVKVVRETADGWIRAETRPWDQVPVRKIEGQVTVKTPETEEVVRLDEAWRAKNVPAPTVLVPVNNVPFDPLRATVVDQCPGESVALTPLHFRQGAVLWVYAARPGPIAFTAHVAPVNKYPWTCGAFVVKSAKGEKIGELPRATDRDEKRIFQAPAAGFYRIDVKAGNASLVFTSCDAPIGFVPHRFDGHDLMRAKGDVWFWHAAGVNQTAFCAGTGEFVTVALFDPEGRQVAEWKDADKWVFRRIDSAEPEGLWRIRLSPPSPGLCYEDANIDLKGVPPVFFLSDKKFFAVK